jgi:hypothetical protein
MAQRFWPSFRISGLWPVRRPHDPPKSDGRLFRRVRDQVESAANLAMGELFFGWQRVAKLSGESPFPLVGLRLPLFSSWCDLCSSGQFLMLPGSHLGRP